MKMSVFAMLTIASFVIFSSGKSDSLPENATGRIAGLWIGAYTINQVPGQRALPYILSVKPDGTITTESKGGDGKTYYHEGTWTLTGTNFRATFTTINRCVSTVTQKALLTFNADNGTLTNGVWSDVINPQGHIDGKFQTFNRVK